MRFTGKIMSGICRITTNLSVNTVNSSRNKDMAWHGVTTIRVNFATFEHVRLDCINTIFQRGDTAISTSINTKDIITGKQRSAFF